jgi:hypothetical protein
MAFYNVSLPKEVFIGLCVIWFIIDGALLIEAIVEKPKSG